MKRIINLLLITALLTVVASPLPKVFAHTPHGYDCIGRDHLGELHWNLSPGQTITYYIFQNGSPDIPDDSEMSQIQGAFKMWWMDVGSYVDFTYGGPTPTHASLQNKVVDGVSVVDFIDLSPDIAIAHTYIWHDTSPIITECDMIFNEHYTFSTNHTAGTYDVANIATHEAGHFLTLYDLYDAADSDQTMYGSADPEETKKISLEWGDKAGVRYIYPNRYQVGSVSLGYETQGADVAVGNIDGVGSTDMVVLWVDNLSGQNMIKYRIGWNLSSTSGSASSWSWTKDMGALWVGIETSGAGVALVNLDGTSNLDMVVLWVDNPSGANTIYYRIGWNLNSAGDPTSWSSLKSMPSSDVGDSTSGAGVAFGNLDANSRPEMAVVWVNNPSGDNTMYYKIGWNVDTSGNPTSWSSRFSIPGGGFGSETSEAGVTLADIGSSYAPYVLDMIPFWIDAPSGDNHGRYRVCYDINSSGMIRGAYETHTFPGDWQWVGQYTQGAGITAADLNNNGRLELIFLWVDNPTYDNYAYYRVEWEGRYDSHS